MHIPAIAFEVLFLGDWWRLRQKNGEQAGAMALDTQI